MLINEKEVKFHWGMIAFEIYKESIVRSLQTNSRVQMMSIQSVTNILWGGIKNYYERMNEDCPITYTEVYDHVEAIGLSGESNPEIEQAIKGFNDSMPVQNHMNKVQAVDEGELKKKRLRKVS